MHFEIRQLDEKDWALWKNIRLEAIKLHPEAFGGAYEEECVQSDEEFKEGLRKSDVFGVFVKKDLVGVTGFFSNQSLKRKHIGVIFSVYVKKEFRGKGAADQLLQTVIKHTRGKVIQIYCSVAAINNSAKKLYARHGFHVYGREPRALYVAGKYYDEDLMVLELDAE